MSMLDSFFNKGFKAAKCKTLLKLTIPRIKLLRNRREIQIKNMRRDIAKLLETGQEATARIRVEHIIREEKMMAAQEIIELFCELIAVRLPIIETQRECPLDLKEAISSVCFAAPRCADLPELQQVQMAFAGKYGREFIAAAAELMPDCGVNRQLIELLSVRAPDADVKLKLLKEIAEEHELDWDPAASETELLKSHEDLLNGPTKLPLPKEKHDETLHSESAQAAKEQSDSDDDFETIDFPDVPSVSVRPNFGTVSAPEMLPFPEDNFESPKSSDLNESFSHDNVASESVPLAKSVENVSESPDIPEVAPTENKQFLPFTSPPSQSFATSSVRQPQQQQHEPSPPSLSSETSCVRQQHEPSPPSLSSATSSVRHQHYEQPPPSIFSETSHVWQQQQEPFPSSLSSATHSVKQPQREPSRPVSRTRSEANVDFQDVLAAAQQAAESAERAAAAARSAASLAQMRINELVRKKSDEVSEGSPENPFHAETKPRLSHQDSSSDSEFPTVHQNIENDFANHRSAFPSYDEPEVVFDSSSPTSDVFGHDSGRQPPQRLVSMDDESYLSYPNLFTRQDSSPGYSGHSDNPRSTQ